MTVQKSSLFSKNPRGGVTESSSTLRGIIWFAASGALSVFINTLMRILHTDLGYHPLQLVFFYSFMGALMYLPSFLRSPAQYRLSQPRLFLARAVLEIGGFTLVFFALTRLPFAMMTVLMFTTPIIGAVAAVLLLGEQMTRNKWLGLMLGFGGIVIVAQPDVDALQWPVLLPLGASLCFAFCAVCIRKLALSEAPSKIAFTTLGMMACLSLPLALTHWRTPELAHLPYLALLALMVGLVQFCVGQALQKIRLTTAQPFMFLNLIWSSLIGWALFGESVALATVLGSVFIIAGIGLSVRKSSVPPGAQEVPMERITSTPAL